MRLPVIHGFIDRRILVNFTADPADVEKILPAPFKPKLVGDRAMVGICLIRLKNIKPKGLPGFLGVSSENGAHRIAVTWERNGSIQEGVYIPRRDTSLALNALAGGRIFPGKHHHTKFDVTEGGGRYSISFTAKDSTRIQVVAEETAQLPEDSVFGSMDQASEFFKGGSAGYSPNGRSFDGIFLETYQWKLEPLKVHNVASSFFQDTAIFPAGVKFDNALLMRRVEHEWKGLPDL